MSENVKKLKLGLLSYFQQCDGFRIRIRIRQFFRNPKFDGYLKSDRDGFKILVSVQLICYFRK